MWVPCTILFNITLVALQSTVRRVSRFTKPNPGRHTNDQTECHICPSISNRLQSLYKADKKWTMWGVNARRRNSLSGTSRESTSLLILKLFLACITASYLSTTFSRPDCLALCSKPILLSSLLVLLRIPRINPYQIHIQRNYDSMGYQTRPSTRNSPQNTSTTRGESPALTNKVLHLAHNIYAGQSNRIYLWFLPTIIITIPSNNKNIYLIRHVFPHLCYRNVPMALLV